MFDEIAIHGVGVIESATIRLAPGLTVVTGETGAGKTMVVTALELLLGVRADSAVVRAGVDAARVEARLTRVPPAAVEHGYADESDPELVVSRELVPASGGLRSTVRIGGRLATVGALTEVLGRCVEVHSQGAHMRLAQPAVQRDLLDRYAGAEHAAVLEAYGEAYREWDETRDRLSSLRTDERERAREVDRLRHEISEIRTAAPEPGEDARVEEEVERLEHAEQLIHGAMGAAEALSETGAGGPLGVAVASLRAVAGHDQALEDLLGRAEGLAAEAAELRRDLRGYTESVDADPAVLEQARARRRLLAELLRKYADDLSGVLAYAEEAESRLASIERADSDAAALEDHLPVLAERLHDLAGKVRAGRERAAKALGDAVAGHLRELSMPHAVFQVRLEALGEPGPAGQEAVCFELSANPDQPPRSLGDSVSGGERSRAALAVEVALADVDDAEVVVFDEIDAGVGGTAALAVGEKLARLAAGREGRQVLCVTHLAQLAAFADMHHVVEKQVVDGRTVTTVRLVGDEDRASELARMLSGIPERSSGLAHAQELLEEAAGRSLRAT